MDSLVNTRVFIKSRDTHAFIMIIAHCRVKKETGDKGGYVSRVRGHKDNGEAAPNIDKELIRPRFWRLEGHEVAAQEAPHHPQRGGDGEVFTALPAPGIQAEWAKPLVERDGNRGEVQRREHGDPQLRAEWEQEREQRYLGT